MYDETVYPIIYYHYDITIVNLISSKLTEN